MGNGLTGKLSFLEGIRRIKEKQLWFQGMKREVKDVVRAVWGTCEAA